jgi:hypothetical protein
MAFSCDRRQKLSCSNSLVVSMAFFAASVFETCAIWPDKKSPALGFGRWHIAIFL